MNVYEVIRRPIITEKGVMKKDEENTLCFEVNAEANKTEKGKSKGKRKAN